ncbi:PC-esterase domain-containing protein 1A-like isoform X1 [Rhinoderma darwinii]|uniref:PC-esterase domain-containing protein 1A-like isoform X1 n=1 Tax=Rhinoderma darwinii TaxID=43563 RepID=UPI003F6636D2
MGCFRSADVRQLLHNKFVLVLGDSIQRSVYKDLVKLLQDDKYLSEAQLKRKGEMTFANDSLVEGGTLNEMHNGTTYREVRQYRTGHHLVRFYFLTRAYSTYLESILSDVQSGPQPDILIANSCVWDLMRYDDKHLETYKTNLDRLFQRLKEVLSPQCLILWNMTMPVGYRDNEIPQYTAHNLRPNIVEGNFFSATLADLHKLDVLDLHYHFRCNLRLRCRDAVHWNQLAHRMYTQILLSHVAQAWGVEAPKGQMVEGSTIHAVPHSVPLRKDPKLHPTIQERTRCSQEAAYIPGYTSFDGSSINALPGVLCPGYLNHGNYINSEDASPFVNDSPVLTANVPPGYFSPSGPAFTNHPFFRRNFLFPNVPQPFNFNPFPHHVPHPQEAWKIPTRRAQKPRDGRINPYARPPMFLPGIY